MKKTMLLVLVWTISLGCDAGAVEDAAEVPATASAPATATPGSTTKSSRTTYAIGGMTCVSCANTIRGGVMKLTGVELATVLFADEQLAVDWAAGATRDDAAVIARVVELGYTAELSKEAP